MKTPTAHVMLGFFAVALPVEAGERAVTQGPRHELRICVDPDNPPLSQNRVGAPPGFDVEIGEAIAERLELRPTLVWADTTYGGKALRRSLLAGQCELFMGLPVDPAAGTSDALSFTAPYYSTGYRLVHGKDRHSSAAIDIDNERIGVERQSGAHMRLEERGSHLVVYGNQREVLDAVARGDVDAGAVWIPDVNRLLHGRVLTLNADDNASPERRLRWNVAIGVRRADTDLRAAVSRVVGELLAEGRMKAIFDRYAVPFFPPFAEREPT
jgi:polar amino acid transport system substrate-binding protein